MRADTPIPLAYIVGGSSTDIRHTRKLLEGLYEIREFSSDESAFISLEVEIPDLIVVNQYLSRFGGFSFMRYVRKKVAGGDIPEIIFSARDSLSAEEQLLAEGEYGAILLPESPSEDGKFFRVTAESLVKMNLARA